jgi:hypothetical protein
MTMQARPRATQRENRMTLDTVRKGPRPAPDRILLVGTEGIGKSTFAADAPSPIFVAAEDGIRHLDVASFPEPKSFEDVLDAVRTLATTEHRFRTFVLDTVDWVEPLVWHSLCVRNGWDSIEGPGYGKGYVAATEEWRRLLLELDRLRAAKGMEIILLAHAALRNVTNPSGPDYSRYECKLHKGAAALLREWTDVNLFAVHDETVSKARGEMKAKVTGTGKRVLHTERTPTWDAKNRHGLPAQLPLSYAEYVAAREAARPAPPDKLYSQAVDLLTVWAPGGDEEKKIAGKLEAARNDATALAKAVDWLKSKIDEKESA